MKKLMTLAASLAFALQVNAAEQEADENNQATSQAAASEAAASEANNQAQSNSQPAEPKQIQQTVLGMNVSGNKELPNVLYIIPWKGNATPAALPKVTRLVDEIYAPVDPEVFQKQVKFYYQLTTPEAPEGEQE